MSKTLTWFTYVSSSLETVSIIEKGFTRASTESLFYFHYQIFTCRSLIFMVVFIQFSNSGTVKLLILETDVFLLALTKYFKTSALHSLLLFNLTFSKILEFFSALSHVQ